MHQVWRDHGRYPRHTQAPHAPHRRPVATLPDAGREPPAPCVGQLRGRLSLPSRLRVECHMRACFYVGSCSFHVILFHNSVDPKSHQAKIKISIGMHSFSRLLGRVCFLVHTDVGRIHKLYS